MCSQSFSLLLLFGSNDCKFWAIYPTLRDFHNTREAKLKTHSLHRIFRQLAFTLYKQEETRSVAEKLAIEIYKERNMKNKKEDRSRPWELPNIDWSPLWSVTATYLYVLRIARPDSVVIQQNLLTNMLRANYECVMTIASQMNENPSFSQRFR